MDSFLNIVNSADVASLIGLIVVLCWVSDRMIQHYPKLRQWGWRFAALAFIGYCLFMGFELKVPTPGAWLGIAFRGVLAAGLTLGISWVALAVYGFLKSYSDQIALKVEMRGHARRSKKERKQQEREAQERLKEWEREAPERERQRKNGEERRLQQEAAAREARQTREDTRYGCELFYNLHAPKIADRFSKADLHDFMRRYMEDSQSLDVIQRRANQLLDTIRQHVEAVDPPEQIPTLDGLASWYEEQKALVEGSNIEPSIKKNVCFQLRERYSELTARLLEEVKP